MDAERLRREASPFKIQTLSALVILAGLFFMSWHNTEMSLPELFQGWHHMRDYMAGNPDIAGSSFFLPPWCPVTCTSICGPCSRPSRWPWWP